MRHAIRLWRRQPVLALAAIVSLALGIGANTAIFSVLNAVVLRPLPYPQAGRLVVAWETSADNPTRWVAPANYLNWAREARSFQSPAWVRLWIAGQDLGAKVVECLHDARAWHEIGKNLARHAAVEIDRLEQWRLDRIVGVDDDASIPIRKPR